MQQKLDKIIESLEEIKTSNGYLILIFFCCISSCTTCYYTKQIAEEQHKTNIYLKRDYNVNMEMQDSLTEEYQSKYKVSEKE